MTLSKTLQKKKVVHLADHSKANRIPLGFKILIQFFEQSGYIPGFPDVVVITSAKKAKDFNKYKKSLSSRHQKLFVLHVTTISKFKQRSSEFCGIADVFWIDDVNILASEVDDVKNSMIAQGFHFIFSGKKSKTTKMKIVVDTREQKPLWKGRDCKVMTMTCGDYTTERLFNKFHIERKSLEDLYGTILKGHVRFRNEHVRALSSSIGLSLYIEGTKKDFAAKRFKGGDKRVCSGKTLVKIIDSIESRWPLEVVWCGSRLRAKKMIYARLQKEERKLS